MSPDVQYYLLSMLRYLFLHCEALIRARKEQGNIFPLIFLSKSNPKEHRGFLIWLQENLLIPKLWLMLRCDYAQVGECAVPLLIHAITLPMGDEVFWNIMNREFTSEQWLVRFKTRSFLSFFNNNFNLSGSSSRALPFGPGGHREGEQASADFAELRLFPSDRFRQ
jgi:hypothetical protein